jgi:hypothetical protein
MVHAAGHYPQAEYPEIVSPTVVDFAGRIFNHRFPSDMFDSFGNEPGSSNG